MKWNKIADPANRVPGTGSKCPGTTSIDEAVN